MTTLREAATRALDALENHTAIKHPQQRHYRDSAIDALRAALAEPEQDGCDHCNHPMYAAIKCRVCGRATEPEQEPVAWMCSDDSLAHKGYSRFSRTCGGDWNIPVYTAPPPRKPLAEPEQEPVAWMYDFLNPDNREEVIRNWVTQDPAEIEREKGFNVRPLYTTPPQRLPLTDEELEVLWDEATNRMEHFCSQYWDFARAIERAHGIGGDQ